MSQQPDAPEQRVSEAAMRAAHEIHGLEHSDGIPDLVGAIASIIQRAIDASQPASAAPDKSREYKARQWIASNMHKIDPLDHFDARGNLIHPEFLAASATDGAPQDSGNETPTLVEPQRQESGDGQLPQEQPMAAYFKAAREKLGLTQAAMSELLGCGEKSYTRWENGAPPTRMVVRLVKSVLGEHDLRRELEEAKGAETGGAQLLALRHECTSALTALYLAVEKRIADDVMNKVTAYVRALEPEPSPVSSGEQGSTGAVLEGEAQMGADGRAETGELRELLTEAREELRELYLRQRGLGGGNFFCNTVLGQRIDAILASSNPEPVSSHAGSQKDSGSETLTPQSDVARTGSGI